MINKSVLFIIEDLCEGGAEKVFVHIANGFSKSGFNVEILLGKNKGDFFDLLDPEIKVSVLNAWTFFGLNYKLPIFFRKNSYTYVFTASDYISAATIIAKFITRAQFQTIVTLHYDLPFQLSILPFLNRKWLVWLNSAILTKATKIVAVSNGVNEGFRKVTKKKGPYPVTIYNPVIDQSVFELANQPIENKFTQHPFIITVGRLCEQKNQLLLLNAFKKNSDKFPELNLLILGTGPDEEDLKSFVNKNELASKVHFLGFKKNPFKYIQKAKLFVLSSKYEGLGNVIIEALSLGINVVSTNCPSGPGEILDQGKFGWLSKINDYHDLALKIDMALTDPKPPTLLQLRAKDFLVNNKVAEYIKLR